MQETTPSTATLLAQFGQAPLAEKIDALQALYERVAFSPSGIMYSMQRFVGDEIRPFIAEDFIGKTSLDTTVGKLQLDGPWDYLHGENSITTSGQYLGAQTFRLQAGGGADAAAQAERAFQSLEAIFTMGVEAGTPGWMCKPYGFRASNQTSPDQYSDCCTGLYLYHKVAPPAHRRRIEEMIVAFAEYWRSVDYTLVYFGNTWKIRDEPSYSNATMMLVNVLAYHFTGDPVYRKEAEWFRDHQYWMTRTPVDEVRAKAEAEWREKGQVEAVGSWWSWITPLLQPGEMLLWESAALCKYVAIAAHIIQELQPDLLGDYLPALMTKWWRHGQYGIDDNLLAVYWFALDLVHDTWRTLPPTELLPREQWPLGNPILSRVSDMRWCDPLARALHTSVIAQRYAPDIAEDARRAARRLLDGLDATRLHWIVDPDGHQLLPEISYYGECLSSEVPATTIASYWHGRLEGLW